MDIMLLEIFCFGAFLLPIFINNNIVTL
jgi:hypothetical protein